MNVQVIVYEDLNKDVYDFFQSSDLFDRWELIPGCPVFECNPETMDEYYNIVNTIKKLDERNIQILVDVLPPEKEGELPMMLMHVVNHQIDLIF